MSMIRARTSLRPIGHNELLPVFGMLYTKELLRVTGGYGSGDNEIEGDADYAVRGTLNTFAVDRPACLTVS